MCFPSTETACMRIQNVEQEFGHGDGRRSQSVININFYISLCLSFWLCLTIFKGFLQVIDVPCWCIYWLCLPSTRTCTQMYAKREVAGEKHTEGETHTTYTHKHTRTHTHIHIQMWVKQHKSPEKGKTGDVGQWSPLSGLTALPGLPCWSAPCSLTPTPQRVRHITPVSPRRRAHSLTNNRGGSPGHSLISAFLGMLSSRPGPARFGPWSFGAFGLPVSRAPFGKFPLHSPSQHQVLCSNSIPLWRHIHFPLLSLLCLWITCYSV